MVLLHRCIDDGVKPAVCPIRRFVDNDVFATRVVCHALETAFLSGLLQPTQRARLARSSRGLRHDRVFWDWRRTLPA